MAESKNKSLSIASLAVYALLAAIVLTGVYASWLRFDKGLGATTHLSDQVPWGLWIWFTLSRVALSAGGFMFCAFFYVFRIEKFHPIVRAAMLTAFVGYGLVGLELIYDLGQPLNFWHPLIYWNIHSPMLETSWCIGCYFGVLSLEMSIPFTEGLGWDRLSGWMKNFCVALAIAGAVLSTLHQSSIGTIMLISQGKLHELWYSSWLPVLFLFSALFGGLGFLVLELFFAERFLGWDFPAGLVKSLGKILLGTLLIYLLVLALDFARLEKWNLLDRDSKATAWFGLEILAGVVLPIILLGFRKVRESKTGLRIAAMLAVAGLFMNRLNVILIGFLLKSKAHYFPTWQEFAVTLMLLTLGLAFLFAFAKRFPIFQNKSS
jgi:Ni/Fe-hydrogenase subunit HybB-like protein